MFAFNFGSAAATEPSSGAPSTGAGSGSTAAETAAPSSVDGVPAAKRAAPAPCQRHTPTALTDDQEDFVSPLELGEATIQLLAQTKAEYETVASGATGTHLKTALSENTDVVQDEYEGGLKLWECSLDLARCVCQQYPTGCEGLHVLEAELRKIAPQGFDLIVSAETAYSLASIDGLVELIQAVLAPTGVVLAANKNYYFGVGGGVRALCSKAETSGFQVETVWASTTGVKRSIVKMQRHSTAAATEQAADAAMRSAAGVK
ncbi:uncharacterized protein MONBRDRAFT_32107 [Monosiga brevicollis MX1]|uniref:Uncharacterized protein n=1 Tax=Monosiga brevicollis TaxID=81824 RepID=A9UXQ3_MONBE|nr:uncharacterized protein MONBRDRAFT_32107 [Monosiga brevicollis MX1]EDQ89729.1 predicted protein [Monosiga brevicollis MX1]|eukprot:XP_001745151.1 hypothetical protein [Monosiga brevicollis MX1]